jgi:putative PEP-CTERM system histidine kinase
VELITLGYALAGLLYTGLFAAIAQRTPAGERARTVALGIAVAVSALWAWSALAAKVFARPEPAIAAALLDLVRYAAWFWWLLALQAPSRLRSGLSAAALAVVVAAVGAPLLQQPGWRIAGFVREASPMVALALPVLGLVLVEQVYRGATEAARWAVKPTCLGLALLFSFDVYLFSQVSLFGRVDGDALSVRAAVHAIAAPLLLLGHARQARPDGRLRLSRTAAFHTAALVFVGGYLLFVAAVGYYVRESGGSWGHALQVALLSVGLVVLAGLILSESMRAKLRVFVGKHFFSYRYEYRAEWLRFTEMLATGSGPQPVGELVVRGLANMVESPGGALWSRDAAGDHLVQVAAWNMRRDESRQPAADAMVRFLADKDWIVDLAEHRVHPHRYDGIAMPDWLRGLPDAWLVVPLRVGETLVGFVVLAQPRTPVPINWEVRDLLKTASRQAAGFLAQVQATEALLEARKFEAFNRMSAFVVHDLKNIVTQLSLMMKNAKRLQDNPEFQQDMIETVENAVDKMRQLMLQLREGTTPADGSAGVALAPVLRRIADGAARRGRPVELDLAEEPFTRGSTERIERVVGHLVQNALDATPPGRRVWLQLARDAGRARIVVGDEGAGMTPEFVRERLGRPFASTKSAGMGIGAYESFQVVREMGGSLEVDSEVGRGTVITLLLPLLDVTQRPSLEAAGAP